MQAKATNAKKANRKVNENPEEIPTEESKHEEGPSRGPKPGVVNLYELCSQIKDCQGQSVDDLMRTLFGFEPVLAQEFGEPQPNSQADTIPSLPKGQSHSKQQKAQMKKLVEAQKKLQ